MEKAVKERPLILISNDDGVHARGLASLCDVIKPFGDVWVVAPERGESGKSHAITITLPLTVSQLIDEPGFKVFSCTGTPVDSVKLALNKILPRKPDFIVSGINHGSNASISVIYSGTMGAAIEGCLNGVPSVGFSLLNHSANADFASSQVIVREVFANLIETGLPKGVCLNVNIPDVKLNEIKGIRVCRQTMGVWKEEYEHRVDPRGKDYYWLTGDFHNFEPNAKDTDEWALANNYAAIVPVEVDFTSYEAMKHIKDWTYELKSHV